MYDNSIISMFTRPDSHDDIFVGFTKKRKKEREKKKVSATIADLNGMAAGVSPLSSVIQNLFGNLDSGSSSQPKTTTGNKDPSQRDKIQVGSKCAIQTLYEGPPECE